MSNVNQSIGHARNGVLYIKKREQSKWALLLVMLWPFLINLISSLPSPLSYAQFVCDGIMLCWCLFAVMGLSRQSTRLRRETIPFVICIGGFLLYTLLTYLFNYQSVLYYLWGIRNNFRAYLLFIYILAHTKRAELDEWLELLDRLFWINAILAIFQFVVGGINQDQLGGIFGTKSGTNGFMLIFLSIVVVKSQLQLYKNKESLWQCLLKSGIALLIGAMAELKFFLLLFVCQLILVIMLTKMSWKKMITLPICMITAFFAMELLAKWFSSSGTFDIVAVIEKAFQENYATQNDLNRLSAIGTLSRTILEEPMERVIGLGLGNCDSSNFAFLRTPFYERYSYLHYRWFSSPMIFLETGYIGLIFYLGLFLLCLIIILKKRKLETKDNFYNNMGIIFAVTAILLSFYNASLRYEGGWMIYIVLALPFVSTGQSQRKG